MLRLALIIALLAGLAALGVSQLVVHKKITDLTGERDQLQVDKTTAEETATKAQADAKKAVEAQKSAEKDRDNFKSQYETSFSEAKQQRKRAEDAENKLSKTTVERNTAQEAIAQWNVLGVTIDQVKDMKSTLANVTKERDMSMAEGVVLNRKLTELKSELARYTGDRVKVPLPPGLKGKVVNVDQNYDFVVLDIGTDQGALPNGEMLVSRDGKLVAKVRLVRVQSKESVANVLPEWKQVDVINGDLVIPAL